VAILVFGGTGLIGSSIVRALAGRGEHVMVASRRPGHIGVANVEWLHCDVGQRQAVQSAFATGRPQRVVHLAAALQFECANDPSLAARVNIAGTSNVLECAREAGVERVVFGSSVAVYGERHDLMREDDPPGPSLSIYGAAKLFEERLGAAMARRGGAQFVALRYSAVFGAGSFEGRGMSRVRNMIASTFSGQDVEIADASGDEAAQLTYVSDAADATLRALDVSALGHPVYNVAGPPENYATLREFAQSVGQLSPRAGHVTFSGRAASLGRVDLSRIENDLQWTPQVRISEGLRILFGARA